MDQSIRQLRCHFPCSSVALAPAAMTHTCVFVSGSLLNAHRRLALRLTSGPIFPLSTVRIRCGGPATPPGVQYCSQVEKSLLWTSSLYPGGHGTSTLESLVMGEEAEGSAGASLGNGGGAPDERRCRRRLTLASQPWAQQRRTRKGQR
jgi:hypothetical protein